MKRRFLLVGSWDMFHYGHLLLIRLARKLADRAGGKLFVAVNTDSLHRNYKKRLVIIPYKHRSEIIGSLKEVDYVVPTRIFSPLSVIRKYRITDYVIPKVWVPTKSKEISYLKSIGGKAHIVSSFHNVAESSTDIRKRIIKLFGSKKWKG